jgi:tetratricopeptide (TPR) repeat protein
MGQVTAVVALSAVLLAPLSVAAQEPPILKRSIGEIEAMVRADSNDGYLQYYLGLAHWKKHHWTQTDSLLRLAVRLEPRLAEGYLALYHLPFSRRSSLAREVAEERVPREWKSAVAEAEGFYQRAFRINPLVSQEVLSIAYYLDDPHFDDLTSPAAQAYDLYFAWMTDFGLGRYNEAYQRLERLAQVRFREAGNPERVPNFILWYRALAAAHAHRWFNAMMDLNTLVKRGDQMEEKEIVHIPLRTNEYRFTWAVVEQRAGVLDRAMELFKESAQNDLGLAMAHTYMAVLYQEAGEQDSCLVERRRAAEVSPDDPAVLFEYAVSLFNGNQASEAEETVRHAMALNPRYAPPYYLLGRIDEELGRIPDARQLFDRFLALAPKRLASMRADAERHLVALKQE